MRDENSHTLLLYFSNKKVGRANEHIACEALSREKYLFDFPVHIAQDGKR